MGCIGLRCQCGSCSHSSGNSGSQVDAEATKRTAGCASGGGCAGPLRAGCQAAGEPSLCEERVAPQAVEVARSLSCDFVVGVRELAGSLDLVAASGPPLLRRPGSQALRSRESARSPREGHHDQGHSLTGPTLLAQLLWFCHV